jgi:hypothetical protein
MMNAKNMIKRRRMLRKRSKKEQRVKVKEYSTRVLKGDKITLGVILWKENYLKKRNPKCGKWGSCFTFWPDLLFG